MFATVRRLASPWGLAAVGAACVVGLLIYLGSTASRADRQQAAYVARAQAASATVQAHAHGLPAPPPAAGTPEQQVASGYQQHLLTPPPGPGTMADVEGDDIILAYLFGGPQGHTEWVQETLRVRNIVGYPLTSIVVPLLPGAFDAHTPDIPGPAVAISGDAALLSTSLPANGGYGYAIVTYQVPYNFMASETWTVPTFLMRGLWVAFWPAESYLAVRGADFRRAPDLDQASGGGIVWSSTTPLRRGVRLTWSIVPADPAHYPGLEKGPATPRNCVSPTGQPLCKGAGG